MGREELLIKGNTSSEPQCEHGTLRVGVCALNSL